MGEDDRYRIEPRLRGMQRGIAPQREDIEMLEERAREAEKLQRPKPKKSFASYLVSDEKHEGEEGGEQEPDAPADEGESAQADGPQASVEAGEKASPALAANQAAQNHRAQVLQQQLVMRLESRRARLERRPSFFKEEPEKKGPPKRGG